MPEDPPERAPAVLQRARALAGRVRDGLTGRVERVPRRARATSAAAIAAAGLGLFAWGLLAPRDGAARLVPGDALAYVHLGLDRDSEQFARAAALVEGFPSFDPLVQQALAGLARSARKPVELADLEPWLGDEAAFALVPDRSQQAARARGRKRRGSRRLKAPLPRRATADSLLLLKVDDQDRALDFAFRIASHRASRGRYRDVLIRTYDERFVTAFLGDFLVIANRERALRRAIDVEAGALRSLAAHPVGRAARSELPGERVADVYFSRIGVRDLLLPQSGVLGTLGRVLAEPALQGAAIALVAREDGLRVVADRALDPEQERSKIGPLGGLRAFEPSLAGKLPATTLAYLGIADLRRALQGLLDQVTVLAPGTSGALRRVRRQLARAENIDLEREVLPLLDGEAALGFEAQTGSVPLALALVEGVEGPKAREALAKLQRPLARALGARRARFTERDLKGAKAYTVGVSALLSPTYALFDQMLAISTDPRGVERVREAKETLSATDLYKRAVGGLPGRVSSLLFLDLQGLFGLAEFAGLGEEPAYVRFRDDLRRLEALGLAVVDGERRSRTELNLVIE